MQGASLKNPAPTPWRLSSLLPLMGVVFFAYLIIGAAMPVVPLYISRELGFGTFVVGLAVSCEFIMALFSRIWAGHYADVRGAKLTVEIGLMTGVVSGLFYFASLSADAVPVAAVALLVLARAILGVAQSFVITGALAWGLSCFGVTNAGKVIAWLGTALWAAYAAGAPLGTWLYGRFGFFAICLVTALLPLLTFLAVLPLEAPLVNKRASKAFAEFSKVLGTVWLPGVGLAFTAVGFGSIVTFGALLFAHKGWDSAWLVFSSLSVSFILGRVFFGHLPDKVGGAKVALVSVLVEGLGGVLIGMAPMPLLAFVGAGITGFGYSLVYPGFGLEAVRLTPPENHGLAMGTYTAFLDLALGVAGPALGLVADAAGLMPVFLVSGAAVWCACPVAVMLLRKKAGPAAS